ncbi:MAG: hypothetical protein V1837_03095 [Candidatus Woesearchaeota archaeon]
MRQWKQQMGLLVLITTILAAISLMLDTQSLTSYLVMSQEEIHHIRCNDEIILSKGQNIVATIEGYPTKADTNICSAIQEGIRCTWQDVQVGQNTVEVQYTVDNKQNNCTIKVRMT